MPRYHFHSAAEYKELDVEGTELADEATARIEAIRYAGETLRWRPENLERNGYWKVEVADENGVLRYSVIAIAVEVPCI